MSEKKRVWRGGNMLYPVPVVLISCGAGENTNLFTVAWTGTICSDPPMVSVSVRPSRYSYELIRNTGEFVINLTTEKLVKAVDYCGVISGRDHDKWQETKLHPGPGKTVSAPIVEESPVNLECVVTEEKNLGTHTMFLAKVTAVQVAEEYLDEKESFHLEQAKPIVYSHGTYYGLGEGFGTFGYSVRRKKRK